MKNSKRTRNDRIPFFFRKIIRLSLDERDYVERCMTSAMQRLKKLQPQQTSDSVKDFDLVSGLASYLVFLRHIYVGREIRYSAILHIAGAMSAYMGHERILDMMEREGVALDKLYWSPCVLSVLSAAIIGHRDALAARLLERFPHLADIPFWHDAVAICVKYGTVRMLRLMHSHGVNLDRRYMTRRRKVKTPVPSVRLSILPSPATGPTCRRNF